MRDTASETSRNNLIANGTTLKGDIEVAGDIRIDGKIIGTLRSNGKVVLGQHGIIEGNITCKNADFSGYVKGTIVVEELTSLKSTSHLEVDLRTKKLFIEVGAFFTGKCDMNEKVTDTQKKQA